MKRSFHKTETVFFARSSRGFTIIEVAIAMLVLSIGLLGVAGLQASGMQSTYESHQRAIAMNQAKDLADRMRANIRGMREKDYVGAIPVAQPNPDCESSASTCNTTQLADSDLYAWQSTNGQVLPAGQGAVACTDINGATADVLESGSSCLITMRWDGNRDGATGLGCDPNNIGAGGDLTCLRMRFIP